MTWETWLAVAAGIFCLFGISVFVLALEWSFLSGRKASSRPSVTSATVVPVPGQPSAAELLAAFWVASQSEGTRKAAEIHAAAMADQVAGDMATKFAATSLPKVQPPAS